MLLRYIFCSNNVKGLAQDDWVTANLESLPCFAHLRLIVWSHFLCLCLPSLHHKLHRRHRSRIQKRSHNHNSLQFRTYSGICPHRSNSGAVRHVIGEELFSSYQHYSSIAFVAVIVVVGVNIFMKKFGTCTTKEPDSLGVSKLTQWFDIRAFFMGFTRGLVLCPPLIALLLYAVTFSQVDYTILAVLFGV